MALPAVAQTLGVDDHGAARGWGGATAGALAAAPSRARAYGTPSLWQIGLSLNCNDPSVCLETGFIAWKRGNYAFTTETCFCPLYC